MPTAGDLEALWGAPDSTSKVGKLRPFWRDRGQMGGVAKLWINSSQCVQAPCLPCPCQTGSGYSLPNLSLSRPLPVPWVHRGGGVATRRHSSSGHVLLAPGARLPPVQTRVPSIYMSHRMYICWERARFPAVLTSAWAPGRGLKPCPISCSTTGPSQPQPVCPPVRLCLRLCPRFSRPDAAPVTGATLHPPVHMTVKWSTCVLYLASLHSVYICIHIHIYNIYEDCKC